MDQEKFIECRKPRIRCIAGPGTGKTWAMREKVKNLCNYSGSLLRLQTFSTRKVLYLIDDVNYNYKLMD